MSNVNLPILLFFSLRSYYFQYFFPFCDSVNMFFIFICSNSKNFLSPYSLQIVKMTKLTKQERAHIAVKFEASKSIHEVQVWWRSVKGKNAILDPKTIRHGHRKLMQEGDLCDSKRQGRPSKVKNDVNVRRVKDICGSTSLRSVRKISFESGLARATVSQILLKIIISVYGNL